MPGSLRNSTGPGGGGQTQDWAEREGGKAPRLVHGIRQGGVVGLPALEPPAMHAGSGGVAVGAWVGGLQVQDDGSGHGGSGMDLFFNIFDDKCKQDGETTFLAVPGAVVVRADILEDAARSRQARIMPMDMDLEVPVKSATMSSSCRWNLSALPVDGVHHGIGFRCQGIIILGGDDISIAEVEVTAPQMVWR